MEKKINEIDSAFTNQKITLESKNLEIHDLMIQKDAVLNESRVIYLLFPDVTFIKIFKFISGKISKSLIYLNSCKKIIRIKLKT